ncbi:Mrr restriction endonuclease-like protein [Bradyrhizobium huanghuaihaiense]|uniref:Mrr restriction endonuclease-like protein n=1 Tax=Bradyrhizobium huanghuaihaiense TaxID=990078 RepID=A0A562QUL4_9BRAD|nr:AAA family ATPase [Bradyrhizobium huanghuaihaiense]TWI60482.1 Mrr restriction endonuclease-like protein [Bradyrhizobium huanghuaihaiense]
MPLPAIAPERIDEALAEFDRDGRELSKWQGWEENASYKHAIAKNGRLYPVKEIVSQATGVATSEFSGGSEANNFVRKLGFQIEPLRLPTESEVRSALHDVLLARAPSSVEPAEAYQVLADRFELPERLRSKLMENSNENHWQNRVRYARFKLVDAGILDNSTHGSWRLLLRQHPEVWVEKTLVEGRIDRKNGPHALGSALWSPLRAQNGADIYRNMRLVQPGDIILHLTDNAAFTGYSIADGFAETNFVGIAGTNWAGLACYRIPLRKFTELVPPLARTRLEADQRTRARLVAIRKQYSNLFYDPDLDLHQGGYLTEAPDILVSLLDSVYRAETGRHLADPLAPLLQDLDVEPMVTTEPKLPTSVEQKRYWLYAPGSKAAHWDDFRDAGIAAIGWDNVGDLSSYATAEAIKARMDQVSSEPQSLINANQCLDFAHRINPGDLIFVKRGRREIIGFGTVQSVYRFEAERPFFRHVRDVVWQNSGSWPTASHRLLPMKTLTEITDDEELIEELEQLVGTSAPTPAAAATVTAKAPIYSIEDFSAETAIPPETISLWLARLKRKQQLVFQGPPGTGKTFVAERLARVLTSGTHGMVDLVQFHPSYGYEDFMHGIRPVTRDGQILFERIPGRFLRFCRAARDVTDGSPCVLIIDEINRGNLSRIFGELMYLLEYRDQVIPLAGEEARFGIPQNVYIIGAMNTADRSIALVDHALRRRFSFIHLAPDYDVMRSQLEKHGLAADGLIHALRTVNTAIDDRNYEVGISFFLKDGAALATTLQDVWEGEIEPYLEEYFYDQPGKLEPLRWHKLSKDVLSSWKSVEPAE